MTEKRREISRKSQTKRRERLRAAGLCIQCGLPAEKTLCPTCMKKQVEANERYKSASK